MHEKDMHIAGVLYASIKTHLEVIFQFKQSYVFLNIYFIAGDLSPLSLSLSLAVVQSLLSKHRR